MSALDQPNRRANTIQILEGGSLSTTQIKVITPPTVVCRLFPWRNASPAFSIFALLAGIVFSTSAGPFRQISIRDSARPAPGGGGDSWGPILTPDGRYVLFASTANNLVPNGGSVRPVPAPPRMNVFRRDRMNGTTVLASVNLTGLGGNGDSIPTGISADGRFALFESGASDLVAGDTNNLNDVFVRDLTGNLTVLVSCGTNGTAGNGVSRGSTMTPDGRYVAFVSAANNLTVADTNGSPDVFVRDLHAGVTTLASVGAHASTPYSLIGSEAPEITPDGRYVAFYSTDTNLVPGVATSGEIYVRDLVAATTSWASTGARAALGGASAVSFNHRISTNGQYVAYEASANPLVFSTASRGVVLRYNLGSGLTDIVNTNACIQSAHVEDIRGLDITPDGRFITFVGNASSSSTAVYLWDGQAQFTKLVSGDRGGIVPANSRCDWPVIDPTGGFVAFLSTAGNLVTNSLAAGSYHLYRRDLVAVETLLVDADATGAGSVGMSPVTAPRLNGNGQLAAFETLDGSLAPNDGNHNLDVFVRDLTAGTNDLISAPDPALTSASLPGPSAISPHSASADGRYVAFTSEANSLIPNAISGFRNVFARDLLLGTTVLVSAATNGVGADGISAEPAISADGRYVVFTSSADNLVSGDTNRAQDVFLRDLQTGSTTLVSVNTTGTGPGNLASYSPVISTDGRYVLFSSSANNVAAGTFTSGTTNLFLRDVQIGQTYALTTAGLSLATMTPDGRVIAFIDTPGASAGKLYVWDSVAGIRTNTFSVTGVGYLGISPDGTRIACTAGTSSALYLADRVAKTTSLLVSSRYPRSSNTGPRFSADGRFMIYAAAPTASGVNQIYLYDLQARTEHLVTTAQGTSTGASANSDAPDISADGRFISYRSSATNLLANPTTNNVPELYLYDRIAGATALLTANYDTGAPADNRSLTPIFTGDGHTLFFQSWASDLVPLDFNQGGDVFELAFLYASVTPGTVPGQGVTINWPNRPGETYHVQYKNDLDAAAWQETGGTVILTGNQAQLTDPSPAGSPRFYRVVVY